MTSLLERSKEPMREERLCDLEAFRTSSRRPSNRAMSRALLSHVLLREGAWSCSLRPSADSATGLRSLRSGYGATVLAPEDFVATGHRLFIDTNVFMDTDTERSAGLKILFERCKDVAIGNGNGIVVPSKVVDELYKQSSLDVTLFSEERAAAVHRVGQWLTALESGAAHGLIRKDLGDGSNPYADDLFVDLFTHFSDRYDMCLLTNDITLRLRIRLLASEAKHQHVAGTIGADGRIAVETDRDLYERAARKLARITRHVEEGLAKPKDYAEVEMLAPLLTNFRHTFGVADIAPKLGDRRDTRVATSSAPQQAAGAFKRVMTLKPKDQLLGAAVISSAGDRVIAESPHSRTALVLGGLLGEGGEGSVYAVQDDQSQIVKIFDKDHRTEHRKAKLKSSILSFALHTTRIGKKCCRISLGTRTLRWSGTTTWTESAIPMI